MADKTSVAEINKLRVHSWMSCALASSGRRATYKALTINTHVLTHEYNYSVSLAGKIDGVYPTLEEAVEAYNVLET